MDIVGCYTNDTLVCPVLDRIECKRRLSRYHLDFSEEWQTQKGENQVHFQLCQSFASPGLPLLVNSP
jgi:hypothetical protein